MEISSNNEAFDRLSRFRPIGWLSQIGYKFTDPNAKWGDCPDCQERCVWVDGRPTAIHEGGVPDEEDDE